MKIFRTAIAIFLAVSCLYSCTSPGGETKEITDKNVPTAKTYTVVIQQMKFTPAALIVNKGDTVKWVNEDIVDHNVTEETNKEWTSGNLPRGNSWNIVVDKSASYFCTIHPVMTGSFTVK